MVSAITDIDANGNGFGDYAVGTTEVELTSSVREVEADLTLTYVAGENVSPSKYL